MMMHVESALKQVSEGKYDVNEIQVGNYKVWMKWDGYGMMCTFYYKGEDIVQWDSLDKTMILLTKEFKEQIRKIKKAIVNLGYQVSEVKYDEFVS